MDKRGKREGGGCDWSRVELDREDPEGVSVESGGGQEDGWDISLEVRVCPYLD